MDEQQQDIVEQTCRRLPAPAGARRPCRQATEWPTLGLAAVIYGGWGLVTWFHAALPGWLLLPLGAWLIAWQSSLQHEVIHGHPTRFRHLNAALALPALWLWVPYYRYRASHLVHHRDPRLTDPLDDPESYYLTAADWAGLGWLGRGLLLCQRTLVGRLALGPAWSVPAYLGREIRAIRGGDRRAARAWAGHLPVVAANILWVVGIAGVGPADYLAMLYGGIALSMLRSFAEHRAVPNWRHRTAIVERAPMFGLLFLYNNLHVVHHQWPRLAWYRIPGCYRAERARLVAFNGGLVYRGYGAVLLRHGLRPIDHPVHPDQRPALASQRAPGFLADYAGS